MITVITLPALAQVDTGIIEGTVKGANGAAVPKTPVTITETRTNISFKVFTDAKGNYVSRPLKSGIYSVSVSAPGFKTSLRSGIVVQVQDRVQVDARLEAGAETETVTATGAASAEGDRHLLCGGRFGDNLQVVRIDPYVGDKEFVKNVAESHAAAAQLGKICLVEKASSAAVKEFGKQMVEADIQTRQELQQSATALKIDLPAEAPRKTKKDEEKLAKLSGADFDHAYAKMAADDQKQVVKQFEREAKNGKLPTLKDYAAKNLPMEQERQKQAEALTTGAGR